MKRTVKKIPSPSKNITVIRNDKSFTLSPIDLDRGDGKYLGFPLAVDAESACYEKLLQWLLLAGQVFVPLTEEQIKAGELTPEQIKEINETNAQLERVSIYNRLVELINNQLRPLWRETVEPFKLDHKASISDDDWKAIVEAFNVILNSELNGERKAREKSSSALRKIASEMAKNLKVLKAQAKGQLSNLSQAEQEQYKKLVVDYKATVAEADRKEAEEKAALLDSLEDFDLDDDSSDDDSQDDE